jgi:hypothetical protein
LIGPLLAICAGFIAGAHVQAATLPSMVAQGGNIAVVGEKDSGAWGALLRTLVHALPSRRRVGIFEDRFEFNSERKYLMPYTEVPQTDDRATTTRTARYAAETPWQAEPGQLRSICHKGLSEGTPATGNTRNTGWLAVNELRVRLVNTSRFQCASITGLANLAG